MPWSDIVRAALLPLQVVALVLVARWVILELDISWAEFWSSLPLG